MQVNTLSSKRASWRDGAQPVDIRSDPEDVERINSIGPQAFIDEQMAWDQIEEDLDTAPPIVNTPIPPPAQPPFTNWIRFQLRSATSTNFFIYLAPAGRVYVDDVRLVLGRMPTWDPNLLVNGDFEDVLTNGWIPWRAIIPVR